MAATGSLRSAPRPQPCAAAIGPPSRRGRRAGPVAGAGEGRAAWAGVRAAPGRPVLPARAADRSASSRCRGRRSEGVESAQTLTGERGAVRDGGRSRVRDLPREGRRPCPVAGAVKPPILQ